MVFMAVNVKVNAETVERLGISCSNVKIEEIKMAVIMVVTQLEEFIAIIVASQDMSSKTVSSSRKRTHNSTIILLVIVTTVIAIKRNMSHKIWFFSNIGHRKVCQ